MVLLRCHKCDGYLRREPATLTCLSCGRFTIILDASPVARLMQLVIDRERRPRSIEAAASVDRSDGAIQLGCVSRAPPAPWCRPARAAPAHRPELGDHMAENDNTPDHSEQALAPRVLEGEIVDGGVAGRVRVLMLRNVFTLERSGTWVAEGQTNSSSSLLPCALSRDGVSPGLMSPGVICRQRQFRDRILQLPHGLAHALDGDCRFDDSRSGIIADALACPYRRILHAVETITPGVRRTTFSVRRERLAPEVLAAGRGSRASLIPFSSPVLGRATSRHVAYGSAPSAVCHARRRGAAARPAARP
jgi:hypothetical protein